MASTDFTAVLGGHCSSNLESFSGAAYRDSLGLSRAVHISGSSTAPSLANASAYPHVVRLSSNEALVGYGLAQLCNRFEWGRVFVVNDDSMWASEAATGFTSAHASHFNGSIAA